MPDVTIAALADTNIKNAEALGAKYAISTVYASLADLIRSESIDVVHICTPPALHYQLAKLAIQNGLHVFIEKPVTLDSASIDELYYLADQNGVSICPSFIQLFLPLMDRARRIVESGQLGRLVHCECYYSLDIRATEAYEQPKPNWEYELPGGIFHNHITHPLYLTLYWLGSVTGVTVSPRSVGILPRDVTDHVEILIQGERLDAHVTLSLATQPITYSLLLRCEQGYVDIDLNRLTLVVVKKSPRAQLDRVLTNISQSYQLTRAVITNGLAVMRGRLVSYQGLQALLNAFYASLMLEEPPPISRDLTVAVVRAEEQILSQAGKVHLELEPLVSELEVNKPLILVTGATGYLGSEVTRQLVAAGCRVRALARALSHVDGLIGEDIEVVYGDVRDYDGLLQGADGIDAIVHLAAGMSGTRDFIIESTVSGTKNIARLARAVSVPQVIYVSSTGIYDYSAIPDGSAITESSPLESSPELRGAYSLAKRQAEDVALAELTGEDGVSWTILRPAVLFGNGRKLSQALAGVKLGSNLICFCKSEQNLKLVHVQDVASSIVAMICMPRAAPGVYNVAHPETVKAKEYVAVMNATTLHPLRVLYVPRTVTTLFSVALAALKKVTGRGPSISRAQRDYWYRDCRIDSSSIMNNIGWKPSASLRSQLINAEV